MNVSHQPGNNIQLSFIKLIINVADPELLFTSILARHSQQLGITLKRCFYLEDGLLGIRICFGMKRILPQLFYLDTVKGGGT
jgi:hypothetical protein